MVCLFQLDIPYVGQFLAELGDPGCVRSGKMRRKIRKRDPVVTIPRSRDRSILVILSGDVAVMLDFVLDRFIGRRALVSSSPQRYFAVAA